jgi:dTDP-4-dehydrorhamnose reductase
MRVYLTGADGLLGTALTRALPPRWPVLGVSIRDFDIADGAAVERSITGFRPAVVVHAAALANVDACEKDPREAMRVNVAGTHHVADTCAGNGIRLIQISSDYVFDGRHGGYREKDVPNPLSVYGMTKLAAERVAQVVPDHLIVRTSWLYGDRPDQDGDQVASLAVQLRAGRCPAAIADQFSSPTYVADLAAALVWLLRSKAAGTVHVANAGRASWHEVGLRVAKHLGGAPAPVGGSECGFVAERPRDSHLSSDLLGALGYQMPRWEDALDRYCEAWMPDARLVP